MVNDSRPTGALHLLEHGPYAPRCPHGHGPLAATTDPQAPTGAAMVCPTCGARRGLEVTMLSTLLNPGGPASRFDVPLAVGPDTPSPSSTEQTTEIPVVKEPVLATDEIAEADEPTAPEEPAGAQATACVPQTPAAGPDEPSAALADDDTQRLLLDTLWKARAEGTRDDIEEPVTAPRSPTRGQRRDGIIRTTGWLQIGGRMVSSGLWALLAGLALGLALLPVSPWFAAALPLAFYLVWRVSTRWIWPATRAVNRGRAPAEELLPGTAVRLHGPIGPVGIVERVQPARRDRVRIDYEGGTRRVVPAGTRCHLVELRD
ncbi:hypothetical protein A8924_3987 [Saccharopolyspora erythraea NRRL 2338]|uniref:Uncharacterized protein n=2 Tax=Saccharopolyspora erythraea TaxID=1836 RepID=A4FFP2_SACEN|nr:hypothetical protein [Saccharopolyspora erythraea]EQD83162.1 hypothetical protein N599_26800 [Saccharopolyspora erythraea D]PFG96587.1 hypothetical protein A8924_3987 [Saccharopolyspora erythraea NRRL 2338]QRK93066.1 hypothetical protein JQX30_18360 [Saccharopolyspora erythraea]CAM02867.1 hypothetical protein SACE_3593 [Saccharopolyspora erythraea NRRL 2338]